jgi:hypothetical protein
MVTASAVDTYRCRPASTTAARIASARRRSAAQISLPAYREDLSLKDAALKFGYRTGEQFDKWVRPEDMIYPLANNARDRAPTRCGRSQGLSRRIVGLASPPRAALEHGAAGGAEVATIMGHALPDTIDVRKIRLAEPRRVRLARRALLRGPLLRGGGRRRKREREAQERGRKRGSGHDRPELRLGATNVHYQSSMWFSVPVSTVNSMIVASSVATSVAVVPRNAGTKIATSPARRCTSTAVWCGLETPAA